MTEERIETETGLELKNLALPALATIDDAIALPTVTNQFVDMLKLSVARSILKQLGLYVTEQMVAAMCELIDVSSVTTAFSEVAEGLLTPDDTEVFRQCCHFFNPLGPLNINELLPKTNEVMAKYVQSYTLPIISHNAETGCYKLNVERR